MDKPLIIYDGNCGFCNWSAYKISKWDKRKVFYYLKIQSEEAQEIVKHIKNLPDSVIVKNSNGLLFESDAIIFIFNRLPYPLKIFSVFKILPKGFRNICYQFVARNRFVFSKNKTCRIIKSES